MGNILKTSHASRILDDYVPSIEETTQMNRLLPTHAQIVVRRKSSAIEYKYTSDYQLQTFQTKLEDRINKTNRVNKVYLHEDFIPFYANVQNKNTYTYSHITVTGANNFKTIPFKRYRRVIAFVHIDWTDEVPDGVDPSRLNYSGPGHKMCLIVDPNDSRMYLLDGSGANKIIHRDIGKLLLLDGYTITSNKKSLEDTQTQYLRNYGGLCAVWSLLFADIFSTETTRTVDEVMAEFEVLSGLQIMYILRQYASYIAESI